MSTLLADFFNTDLTASEVLKTIQENEKNENGFEPLLKNQYKLTGNEGSVKMRILPALKTFHDPNLPFQKFNKHYINFKGAVYDSLCPGFFNDDCAVCSFIRETGINKKDSNSPYKPFNMGDYDKKLPKLKASEEMWVNVYIVEDKQDPKNNGKIFQYKLPYILVNEFLDLYKGNEDISLKPNDPTNLMTGQTLYLKFQIGKNKMRNYEGSKFLTPEPAVDNFGLPLSENKDFFQMIKDGMVQDLYELVNPDERLYDKERSKEKFEEVKKSLDEFIYGADGEHEGSSPGSSRLESGFNEEPKKKTDNKLTDSELEKLTMGELDTIQNDDLNALTEGMGTVSKKEPANEPEKPKQTSESYEDELQDMLADLQNM